MVSPRGDKLRQVGPLVRSARRPATGRRDPAGPVLHHVAQPARTLAFAGAQLVETALDQCERERLVGCLGVLVDVDRQFVFDGGPHSHGVSVHSVGPFPRRWILRSAFLVVAQLVR